MKKIISMVVCCVVLGLLTTRAQARTFSINDLNANRAQYGLPMLTGNPSIDQPILIHECNEGRSFSCTFVEQQQRDAYPEERVEKLPPLGEYGAGRRYQPMDQQIIPLCPLSASQEENARCEQRNQAMENFYKRRQQSQDRRHDADIKNIQENGDRQLRKINGWFH